MTDPDPLIARFDALMEKIRTATTMLDSGQIISLHGLDKQVSELCNDVSQSGPDAHKLKSSIAAMISGLDLLADRLREFQQQAGNR